MKITKTKRYEKSKRKERKAFEQTLKFRAKKGRYSLKNPFKKINLTMPNKHVPVPV
jgi:hypothetical protein